MLKYDFSFAFKETLESGLSFDELLEMGKNTSTILERINSPEPGFLRILSNDSILDEVKTLEDWLENFENFVVIGIGGSALGNQALHSSLNPLNWNNLSREKRMKKARIFVLDNVDPDMVSSILGELDLKTTVFNVISKSGMTAECMSNYLIARGLLDKLGLPARDRKSVV